MAFSQNEQLAQIKALYRYTSLIRHVEGHDLAHDDDMVLLASPVGSRFFSAKTEQYDSLMATAGGKEKYKELLSYAARNALIIENGGITFDRNKVDLPSMGEKFQVTRPDNSAELIVVDNAAQEDFKYIVPVSDLEWTIGNSIKSVLGYECNIATANYHGRKWTVWFTTDIPISSGPWQLMGLPGLIMEAETDGGEYKFEIIGLETTSGVINPRPGSHNYTDTTRKEFRKLQRDIQYNPGKAYPDGSVTFVNMEESIKAKTAHDLIETDYKKKK
ncbi:MAG: GLPGLI family protein [Bacteroides sp.]|nr:GLPGLI family protein [Bacteroides sp.]